MSVLPGPSLHTLFAGLSAEELIAAEADHQLDEEFSITPSVLGKRVTRSEESESDGDTGRSPSPQAGDNSSQGNFTNVAALRMEQAIRRLRKRSKLSNEDTALVEQFAQVCLSNFPLETHS